MPATQTLVATPVTTTVSMPRSRNMVAMSVPASGPLVVFCTTASPIVGASVCDHAGRRMGERRVAAFPHEALGEVVVTLRPSRQVAAVLRPASELGEEDGETMLSELAEQPGDCGDDLLFEAVEIPRGCFWCASRGEPAQR